MTVRICRDNEPDRTAPASHFHTHERLPTYTDGLTDGHATLRHLHGHASPAVRRRHVIEALDHAWEERNRVPVTSDSYDYWAGHIHAYRDSIGLTAERDVDRRRLANAG